MPTAYNRRIVDDELDEYRGQAPAIAIEGPKAVGKTATALQRAATVYRLDDLAQRALMAAGPAVWQDAAPPILLDEWQRWPAVWDTVRREVDAGAAPDRFLLTGSALPPLDDVGRTPHSGAGRILSVRMRPLSLAERGLGPTTVSLGALLSGARAPVEGRTTLDVADYTREIVWSGFPAIRPLAGRMLRATLDAYLDHVVDRDFRDAGYVVRRPQALKRWLTAYAAATATVTSQEKIRLAAVGEDTRGDGGAPPTRVTTIAYREVLQRLWLLDPLEGWAPTRNRLGRVRQQFRHHLADPALAARLIGVGEEALLMGMSSPLFDDPVHETRRWQPRDRTLLGQLFESLVAQSVRVYAQHREARVGHLRMADGQREIDLIVERADGRVVAIEVKLAAAVDDHDVRHLHWLKRQLGDEVLDLVVVNTGGQAYRRADGVAVVPAALLGP
jgi:predicted AAA+ superfamily ATPase